MITEVNGMKCLNCFNDCAPDMNFCNICGAKLDQVPNHMSPPAPFSPAADTAREGGSVPVWDAPSAWDLSRTDDPRADDAPDADDTARKNDAPLSAFEPFRQPQADARDSAAPPEPFSSISSRHGMDAPSQDAPLPKYAPDLSEKRSFQSAYAPYDPKDTPEAQPSASAFDFPQRSRDIDYTSDYVPDYEGLSDTPPLPTKSYVLMNLLMCIPIVNIVLLFVWSFGRVDNENRRNWARGKLIWTAVSIALWTIALLLLLFVFTNVLPGVIGWLNAFGTS